MENVYLHCVTNLLHITINRVVMTNSLENI